MLQALPGFGWVDFSADQVSSTLKQVLSTMPCEYPILITVGSERSVPSFFSQKEILTA